MKKTFLFLCLAFLTSVSHAQYKYEASKQHPFGQANPKAPQQIKDYEELIGICKCKSQTANQDGTWKTPVDMIWKFKYIMNGMAIQDETLKADGTHSGSIRQFNKDSLYWDVHYYSASKSLKTLQSWQGNREDDKITLYKESKAPNGTDGFYKITFSDISKTGFNWLGAWVDKKGKENIAFPLWKIKCKKYNNE